MSTCIEKIPHSCGSKDGVQVFQKEDGTYDAYAFCCGVYIHNPYEGNPSHVVPSVRKKSDEEVDEEASEIYSLPESLDLPTRKLKAEYLNYFGYKVGLSRSDGTTPSTMYRPYENEDLELASYKAKVIGTGQTWWITKGEFVMPFGWRQAIESGAKRLMITEGEEDAVALFQAIKEGNIGSSYEKFNPAVVSLPNGAGSAVKYLAKIQDKINQHFKEVILVFDQDAPGKKASAAVCKDLFREAKVASLPEKDANACVMAGKSKALASAVQFNAIIPKNTSIVWGEQLHEAAKKPAEFGVSWPWKEVTKKTRGLRKGETIYIGAAPKFGKSELVDSIAAWLMKEHGWKCLLAKPEQANIKTYKMVAGKMVGKIFHDPNVPFDEAAYEEAGIQLKGKLAMLDLYQHLGWVTLQKDIRAAAAAGVDVVFIDPITNLTNGINSGEANTVLQEVAQELSSMAMDLNILIFIMCHLKNPESGLSHDRGGKVLSSQFAGSRAMSRSCNYMFALEGNKDPDLPKEQRNIRDLVLLEDREFGEAGRFSLYWDDRTGLFNEVHV